jgi:hypothetical protein
MLRRIILSAAMVAGCAGFARAAAENDIHAAMQKLADSPNYSWKTTVEGGFGAGETTGKTQKDGLTTLSVTRQDNPFEIVIQGDKAAVKTDDGWKSGAELAAAAGGGGGGGGQGAPSPDRILAMMVQTFKTPVAQALEYKDKLQNVQKTDEGYTAELTEDAAKAALTFRRRNPNAAAGGAGGAAPTVTNPKVTIKFWIKDGVLTKMENHATGTVSFNGNDRDVDRTTTTEFSNVGTTEVKVPEEAKAKLTAPPATQP